MPGQGKIRADRTASRCVVAAAVASIANDIVLIRKLIARLPEAKKLLLPFEGDLAAELNERKSTE